MTAKESFAVFAISGGDSMGLPDGLLLGALGGEMRFGGSKMKNQEAADKSVRAPLEYEFE